MQRRYLRDYVSAEVEARVVVPPGLQGDPVGPTDVIFLLKQYVCSTELVQLPQLLLPAARLARLSPMSLTPLPRNVLTHDAIKEYRKTANRVAKPPWNLHRARQYLHDWTNRNKENSKTNLAMSVSS